MEHHQKWALSVSQNIESRNEFQTPQDLQATDNFGFDDDLAMFTFTHFFDLDLGYDIDLKLANSGDMGGENVSLDSSDIGTLNSSPLGYFDSLDFTQDPQNLEENDGPQTPTRVQIDPLLRPLSGSSSALNPIYSASKEENISSSSQPKSLDNTDTDRLAAEEDKRRRNTIASARFRLKKKRQEQALEKSATELSGKVMELQSKINRLETENEWMKGLIAVKNESKGDTDALQRTVAIRLLREKLSKGLNEE